MIYVIDSNERNVVDQKITEYQLFMEYGIPSIRITFDEMKE